MLGFSSKKQLLPTQEVTIACSTQARLPVVRQSIEEEMSYLDVTGSTQKGTIVALLEWGQFNRIGKSWRIPLEQIKVAPESKKLGSVAIYQLAFLFWRTIQSSSRVDILFKYSDSPLVSALIQTAHLFNVRVFFEEGAWEKHLLRHASEILQKEELNQQEFKQIIDFSDQGDGTIKQIHIAPPNSIWKWYHRAQKTVTLVWQPQDLGLILYLLQQESIDPIFPDESQWKVVFPEKKKKATRKSSLKNPEKKKDKDAISSSAKTLVSKSKSLKKTKENGKPVSPTVKKSTKKTKSKKAVSHKKNK